MSQKVEKSKRGGGVSTKNQKVQNSEFGFFEMGRGTEISGFKGIFWQF